MSWTVSGETVGGQITGVERDDAVARFDCNLASTTPTCETTYAALGSDRCMKLPVGTSGSKALCSFATSAGGVAPTFGTNTLKLFTFDVGGGATTSDATLIYNRSSAGNPGCIRLNSSPRTVSVYSSDGVQRAVSTSLWSTTALTRFYVLIDCIDSTNTKIAIWNKYRVLESYQITGINRTTFFGSGTDCWFGEWLGAGVNRGADIYGGVILETSDVAADNPLWARYPVLNVTGGGGLPPTGDGSFSEFDGSETGGGTDAADTAYQNVDEGDSPSSHPGHDSDTTFNGLWSGTGSGNSLRQTQTYSAANPVPAGAGIRFVELGTTIRGTGSGKAQGNGMLYDGTNTLILPYVQASTSYVGTKAQSGFNPAGSKWTAGDFDLSGGKSVLEFGLRTLTVAEASGATIGGRQTNQPGPVIVYATPGKYLQTLGGGY